MPAERGVPVPDPRRKPPVLLTERLCVRLPGQGDVPALVHHFASNAVHFAPTDPLRPADFLTPGYWQAQVRAAQREFADDRALRLVLVPREEPGAIAGTANFSQIVRGPFQACVLGYGLGARFQGQGLMTEGLQAALSYVFGPLGLHRVMANHLPENTRSAKVLQRLGFEVEGFARDYLMIAGRWRDHVLNARVHDGWQPRS